MGVRRKLLKELLGSLKYIKNLTEQQISASLWGGKATLYDLELDPQQLQKLFYDAFPCGVEILEASVKELCIRIPWRQIMTQSIVMVAHDVEVRAVVHCEDEANWREVVAGLQQNFVRKQSEKIENSPINLLSGPSGAFDQMRQRITDGMQVQVSKCSLSLLSCHPRHFPSHTPATVEGSNRPLAEILRVVGEDIMISPSDSNQMATDKLKAMAVYMPNERVLQLSKFMKCRSLRVSPGRGTTACPHAAEEFMESPVVLSCHVCQKYPSDGSRICPFIVGNQLTWEFCSTLGITACECQVRAVVAAVMDIGRLEEWRINKDMLKEDPVTSNPESSESTPVIKPHLEGNEDPAVNGLDKLEELPISSEERAAESEEDDFDDMLSCHSDGSSLPFDPLEFGHEIFGIATHCEDSCEDSCIEGCEYQGKLSYKSVGSPVSATTVDQNLGRLGSGSLETTSYALSFKSVGSAVEDIAIDQSLGQDGFGTSHASSCAIEQEQQVAQPISTDIAAANEDVPVDGSKNEAPPDALPNTTCDSRTLARGSKPEDRPHGRRRFDGLRSAVDIEFKHIAKDLKGLVRAEQAQGNASLEPPLLDGEPLMNTSDVARVFARGPEQRSQAEHSSSAGSSRATGLLETMALPQHLSWKKIWSKRKELGKGLPALRESPACDAVGQDSHAIAEPQRSQSKQSVASGDGDDNSKGSRSEDEAGDDGVEPPRQEEDEEGFHDVQDYFSTASGEEVMVGDAASSRGHWLKPMLKWFGNTAKTSHDSHPNMTGWPDMNERIAIMGIGAGRLVLRITAVESLCSQPTSSQPHNALDSGIIEICIDSLTWRSEVHLALPSAHMDCIERLKNPTEERGIVAQVATRTVPAIGPWCLPTLQYSAQAMQWPVVFLKFRRLEDESRDIDLMVGCGAGQQLPTSNMISFDWRPRDCPPLAVVSSPWVLHSWPIDILFNRVSIIADTRPWLSVKACWERCKPFFASKCPPSSLIPPQQPEDSSQLFPVECFFLEFTNCEITEPHQDHLISNERRWPLHITLPHVKMRSNSNFCDFSQVLALVRDGYERNAKTDQHMEPGTSEGTDKDVTIPKAMFDNLVNRAAESTLQQSQVKAAREELQKAYIKLAEQKARAGAQGASSSAQLSHNSDNRKSVLPWGSSFSAASAGGEPERTQSTNISDVAETTESDELDKLRRKCSQLESSLNSQGLVNRRLEAELASFHALARDELRQVLSSCTAAASTASASTSGATEMVGAQGGAMTSCTASATSTSQLY